MRRLAATCATVVLACAGMTVAAAPAHADTTLCSGSGYSTCVNAGYTDHGYGGNSGTSYWGMYAGHNCTNYVAYVEQSILGVPAPPYSLGNAYQWGPNASAHGVPVNATPTAGAVAWWNQYAGLGSLGHVAFVESVNGDGSITVSEDSASSGPFDWMTISPGSSRWPTSFIHFISSGGSSLNYQAFAGNADGVSSGVIGLRNVDNGVVFLKDGPSFNDQTAYPWAAGANYQPFVGDFNGDGVIDIGLRDVNIGMIYIKHGPSFNDQVDYQWAAGSNYQIFAGDFNGDSIGDIGLRDSNNGVFYIKHGPSFNDQVDYPWATGANYQVLAGDFNGDGIGDIGLRDIDNGVFYFKHGTGFNDQVDYQWAAG